MIPPPHAQDFPYLYRFLEEAWESNGYSNDMCSKDHSIKNQLIPHLPL
jgi:hypothetical protein